MGRGAAGAAPLIKFLLSINPGSHTVAKIDAQQRRVKTVAALRKLAFKLAESRPLVLVVEDLHWIDKSSEDFLVSFAESLAKAHLLLILSFRPEYPAPFPEAPQTTRLRLQQLSGPESLQLARKVLAGEAPPPALEQMIGARAEGNPFFVEELIKSLLEAGALELSRRRGGAV